MTLRDAIVEELDVERVLKELLDVPVQDKGNDWRIYCPWHNDKKPSLNVHKETGVLHCFACDLEKKSIFDLVMELNGVGYRDAEKLLADFHGIDPSNPVATAPKTHPKVTPGKTREEKDEAAEKEVRPELDISVVMKFHENLMTRFDTQRQYLNNELGISNKTLKKFAIGYDGDRFTIPILDDEGTLVNIRKYDPFSTTGEKFKNHYEMGEVEGLRQPIGYGSPARLFPLTALAGDEVLLVEGEKDMLVATDRGFNAITTTGGANRWRPKWNELFRGKRVFICYDMDKAGQEGAEAIARELESVTGVYIVELPKPSKDYKGYDLSNYFNDEGATAEDFKMVLADARTFTTPRIPTTTPAVGVSGGAITPIPVSLGLASIASNMKKLLTTKAVVSGKNMAPYIIPKKLKVTCDCANEDDACASCPRWHGSTATRSSSYSETLDLDASNPQLLKLIGCSDTQQKGYLKEIAGISKKCYMGKVEIAESGNMQQIIIIPELDAAVSGLEEQEYVSRNAYYCGHDIIANRSYNLTGYTWPHPMNQTATHVFDHKDDMQDSIRSFEMTEDIRDELAKLFRPVAGQTIEDKLNDIYTFHVKNTHGIRGRPEVQLAFDLVWHSVLHFNFLGQPVRKGWLEGLIVGDTSQGKTELTTRLRDYYNLGQRITGEKTSASGLIGGLEKVGDQWILRWGAYPQNDRRALLIDEYSSLKPEEIANMTDLRSTGVAEIVKIRTERTNARVRALLCSNLRSGQMLRDVAQGITGVKSLMGKNEDIRRLDFALTVATGEVSLEEINKPRRSIPDSRFEYTREASKNLVLWSWSRNISSATANQVEFSSAAEEAILKHARRLGEKYHPRIPLVEPSDQRLKIARLAVALACRLFSTDESGEIVVVNQDHVDYIVNWLEKQYDKPSMAYDSWSATAWSSEVFTPAAKAELENLIEDFPSGDDIVLFFTRQNKGFRQQEFESATGLDREDIKKFIQVLIRHNALAVDGNGYHMQPNLNMLMKELKVKRGL